MNYLNNYLLGIFIVMSLLFTACGDEIVNTPRPRGYFRIVLPKKAYQTYNKTDLPYTFDYPKYAKIVADSSKKSKQFWKNIFFPQFNARIHLSYWPVANKKMLNQLIEDSHTFAFKHTIKAESIDEASIADKKRKVYGVYYIIQGNTASSVQFFLTDSTKHYLRGALYFWDKPKLDSIKPVLDFVHQDMNVLIKTLKWR